MRWPRRSTCRSRRLFAETDERRDCSFVKGGAGVRIERRGTKAGHLYDLLGHTLGGAIGVEPYLITLAEGAAPYTHFRHAGVEFIYMLSGKSVPSRRPYLSDGARRRAVLRRCGPARTGRIDQSTDAIPFYHYLSARGLSVARHIMPSHDALIAANFCEGRRSPPCHVLIASTHDPRLIADVAPPPIAQLSGFRCGLD